MLKSCLFIYGVVSMPKLLDRFFIKVWYWRLDRLCGLVVRVLGYRSRGPGSIPGTTKESSGSGTGCTQPREYNLGAT
jgi:hypothetical protein